MSGKEEKLAQLFGRLAEIGGEEGLELDPNKNYLEYIVKTSGYFVRLLQKSHSELLRIPLPTQKQHNQMDEIKIHVDEFLMVGEMGRVAQFWIERGNADEALNAATAAGVMWHSIFITKGYEKILKNLNAGRSKGVEDKKAIAESRHALIKKALDHLYKHGKGWQMSYPQISVFLIDKKVSEYTETQTLKLVKKYAPELKEKNRQK
jgi:hypothetical protein